jgi:hypothetical protein
LAKSFRGFSPSALGSVVLGPVRQSITEESAAWWNKAVYLLEERKERENEREREREARDIPITYFPLLLQFCHLPIVLTALSPSMD